MNRSLVFDLKPFTSDLSLSPPRAAEAENRPKSAHRYNVAEQQLIYKSEIERIWKAQFDSLSRKDEPQLTAEDEERNAVPKAASQPRRMSTVAPDGFYTPALSPSTGRHSVPPSPAFSRASSLDRDREISLGPESSRRVLRIRRMVSPGGQHVLFMFILRFRWMVIRTMRLFETRR
jgi:transcription initiation factor TFIID subunit 1, fungi type